jgi:hypothetical protein
MENYSLSDIAAATGEGFGGANSWVMIILFALIFGWGGNGFGGFNNAIGYENLATSNEVQRGFDNQNSMANQREILAAVNSGTAQSVAATNQTFHDTLGIIQNRYDELQRDISGLAVGQANALANQNACCCETRMEIQQGNNALMQAIQAEGAQTRALIQGNKIEALQAQVSQLQLDQALQGVVRYPNSWNFNAGPAPFCNPCGCNI